jgi:hypothetical protein
MMVEHLLKMYRERIVLFFPYTDYPKWSRKTVYQYVQNGFKFAVDYLDNEEKELQKLREEVDIRYGKKDGVRIVWKVDNAPHTLKPQYLTADDPLAKGLEDIQDAAPNEDGDLDLSWRQKLMTWMEVSQLGDEFNDKEIKLTDEDISYVNGLFEDSPVFGHIVNEGNRTFKVRRIG